ncbi:hypothetical protein [Pelagibius marinus]|uniref:hypothetical protein n=1 Tax=Pelagibius marinus TaxID=2762760 RepID=UPI001D03A54E|nr:hypothetical protein [Pelagibius marinus]
MKARKDLLQVELLKAILAEDGPSDLPEAYQDEGSRGPHWRERIGRSLTRVTDAATAVLHCT